MRFVLAAELTTVIVYNIAYKMLIRYACLVYWNQLYIYTVCNMPKPIWSTTFGFLMPLLSNQYQVQKMIPKRVPYSLGLFWGTSLKSGHIMDLHAFSIWDYILCNSWSGKLPNCHVNSGIGITHKVPDYTMANKHGCRRQHFPAELCAKWVSLLT